MKWPYRLFLLGIACLIVSYAIAARGEEQSILVPTAGEAQVQPVVQPVVQPAMRQATATVYQPVYGMSCTARCRFFGRGLKYSWTPYYAGSIGYQVPLYQWQLHPLMVPQ